MHARIFRVYVYDEIELVIVEDDDEEYYEADMGEEELPDYGEEDQGGGADDNAKREEVLEVSRKESVESFEQVLSKLSMAIPCHRCGSDDHSVLDCTVGATVREMANDLKRVIGEKNYTMEDSRNTRGSSGEAPPKKHRKAEKKVPEDPGVEY